MHFPRIIPTEILETMKSKEITFLLQTNNTGIRQVVLNKHSARAHDLERPKKSTYTDTIVQYQNTSGFESTGEPASSP